MNGRRQRSRAEQVLRRLASVGQEQLECLSPASMVRLPALDPSTRIAVASVYRRANVGFLQALLADAPSTTSVALWALDEVAPEVAPVTVGSGPGGRLQLLNQLIDRLPPSDYLVLVDDDVRFVAGDLGRTVAAGQLFGFDLFQPAHSAQSTTAFTFTAKHPTAFARETSFVEQGPMLVLSRRAQRVVLPLPSEMGMGWGVEVRWSSASATHDLRMGIVDAVSIRHMGAPGYAYDVARETAQLHAEVRAAGLQDIRDLHRTTSVITAGTARRRALAQERARRLHRLDPVALPDGIAPFRR